MRMSPKYLLKLRFSTNGGKFPLPLLSTPLARYDGTFAGGTSAATLSDGTSISGASLSL